MRGPTFLLAFAKRKWYHRRMKHLCIVAISAALSAACLATETSDAVAASVVKAIMPSGGSSAVVSPYSVAVAAGLLGDGMDSRDARIALSEKMGLKTTSFGPTFLRNRMKFEEWGRTNGVEVLFANSAWMRNYSRIERDFHAMAYRDYDFAFGPLSAVESMNAWSSVRTGGHVSKVVDEVDPGCDTVLISASGFDGAWARPFPPAVDGVFHAEGGDVSLPMMRDVRTLRMVKRPGYTAFSLAYRGGKLFLYVVLPDRGKTPRAMMESLQPSELFMLDRALLPDFNPDDDRGNPMPPVEGASEATVRLSLPRFRIETKVDFLPALAALGVQRTGYDAICKDMRIGIALQSNVFAVSETGGEVGKFDLPAAKAEGELAEIACDRPFAFVVRTVDRITLMSGVFAGR